MKLEVSSSIQQTKTELDEKFFTIGDPAFIFDLLRNKIYGNPIAAVCREITCNALDAHREVGKEDTPVIISLPSYTDLYFKVKDYGPGISPDRMDNIFLNYGASTKRDTNNQIGGFGLGAKSPFAYSDSFTIVTNYNGKSYNYCAFIDESKVGKLILLSETNTDEPNGTEIIIPVKDADVNNFIIWTEYSTRHWKVKPSFLGKEVAYRTPTPNVIGTNWFAANSTDQYSYEKKIKAIVGEIEYPLDSGALRTFADINVMNMLGQDLYLKFQVGEVSLAANRESVYLDNPTKEIVKERLLIAKDEFKNSIIEKIENMPSLWDANEFVANDLHSLCANPSLIGDIYWRGIRVKGSLYGGENFTTIEFNKKSTYSDTYKLSRYSGNGIRFNKKSKIVMHDCGEHEPNTKHVKKFFEEDKDLKSIIVVVPVKDKNLDQIIEDYNFELMNVDYLSRFNTEVKAKRSINRTTAFQYTGGNNPFSLTSVKDISKDTNEKVLCYLKKDTFRNIRESYRKDKVTHASPRLLKELKKIYPNVSFYGIDHETNEAKIKTIFGKYIMIDDLIERTVADYTKDWYLETKWILNQNSSVKYSSSFIRNIADKVVEKINNKNNLLCKLIEMSNKIDKLSCERRDHMNICEVMHHEPATMNEYDEYATAMSKESIEQLWKKIKSDYPLIRLVDSAYSPEEYVNAAAEYINLMDAK